MSSSTVRVDLPDTLREFVDARVRDGEFPDAAEYLRELVRRDHEAQLERFRGLIREGLESGDAAPLTDEEISALRRRVRSVAL